jgi:hypothetical protein
MTAVHPGVGTIWSERDLTRARKLRSASLSFHEIGRALNRSAEAVSAALASDQVRLGRTILADYEYGHLIGSPKVVIDRHATGATVTLQQAPWGFSRTHLEFLSANDPAIDSFVQELLTRVRLLGEREWDRREKRRQAKDQARNRRCQ